ncbi:hypothetical protein NMY22_g14584 [Coprinellus aureogranulatus]|nr:hypothetical protein NMY22_g14584 [Coprinellus aureogranulatus]
MMIVESSFHCDRRDEHTDEIGIEEVQITYHAFTIRLGLRISESLNLTSSSSLLLTAADNVEAKLNVDDNGGRHSTTPSRLSYLNILPHKNTPVAVVARHAFQLQEYISLLIRLDIHDVEAITSLPGSKDSKDGENQDGEGSGEKQVTVDEACWVYEQLRRLAQDLTHPLITTLQQECTRATCPEMKAGEWLYLCVAHGNEGSMEQCCAIDYILHTLDAATALLSSPRAFPSRIQIPATSHRHFSSLADG